MITADPAPYPDPGPVRQPRLLPLHRWRVVLDTQLREFRHRGVEPWRHLPRHKSFVDGLRRPWRAPPGHRQHLGQRNRHPAYLMALLGLTDDYGHQGAVISQLLDPRSSRPYAVRVPRLAAIYTALTPSPLGGPLTLSTRGLAGGSPADVRLPAHGAGHHRAGSPARALGSAMIALLERAAFSGQAIWPPEADRLVDGGYRLLLEAERLANGSNALPLTFARLPEGKRVYYAGHSGAGKRAEVCCGGAG